MPDSSQDVLNKALGRRAEALTAAFLRRHGYKIVETNFVTPFGEADIIARAKDGTYCFVEVKARTGDPMVSPVEAVTPKKQARYRKIALTFCAKLGREVPVRFDIAAVLNDKLDYFENAFLGEGPN